MRQKYIYILKNPTNPYGALITMAKLNIYYRTRQNVTVSLMNMQLNLISGQSGQRQSDSHFITPYGQEKNRE